MPMPKKANGGNLKVSDGKLTVRFDTDGPSVVHVVCVWGAKGEFGGQRARLWCSETETSSKAVTVTVPAGLAMAGAQMTWSGGLVARGKSQGRLLVTVTQEHGESGEFSYEYSFAKKNETESFYDGLNFA